MLALGAGIGVTGCGSGQSQGATEPTGNFPVQVTTAKFPNHQKLAESSYLVLAIKNAGSQTIPDLAVTINTQAKGTPNLKSPATSTGSGQGSFNIRVDEPNLASHFRPVWVLEEHYPKLITDKFPLSKIENGANGGRRGRADRHLPVRLGSVGRLQGHRLARHTRPRRDLHGPLPDRGGADRQGEGGDARRQPGERRVRFHDLGQAPEQLRDRQRQGRQLPAGGVTAV